MAGENGRTQDEFFYLSEVLNRPVVSRDGERVGRLTDIGFTSGESYPRAVTFYLRAGWFSALPLAVPAPAFALIPEAVLRLTVDTSVMQPVFRRGPSEILLRREILDKQIVDTDGARMVRVNDIHLLRTKSGEVHVVHVDIGYRGLLRRLGWLKPLAGLLGLVGLGRKILAEEHLLSWRNVVPLRSGQLSQDLRLNVTQTQLAGLHPAELAEIVEEMDRFEGPAMLQALDVPTAAQTLAELSSETQRFLIEALDIKRAAALIAAMAPDEEADLLEELPVYLREKLIANLPAADAATVTDLLSHDPDTAGSLMNPEVATVLPGKTVEELVEVVRQNAGDLSRGHAVVVVDGDSKLRGVIGLAHLALADRGRKVEEVMEADPVTVKATDPMREVAEVFDRFNLLAAPVVDEEGRFEGVVTVDDVVAWLRLGEDKEGGLT